MKHDRIESVGLSLALIENVSPDFGTGEALQFNGIFIHSPLRAGARCDNGSHTTSR